MHCCSGLLRPLAPLMLLTAKCCYRGVLTPSTRPSQAEKRPPLSLVTVRRARPAKRWFRSMFVLIVLHDTAMLAVLQRTFAPVPSSCGLLISYC